MIENKKIEYNCYLDDPKWRQCCCNCKHHVAIYYNCCTDPKPDKSLYPDNKCCCNVFKSWACVVHLTCYPNEGDNIKIYDNWAEHSAGCELYTERNKNNDSRTATATATATATNDTRTNKSY